MNILIFDTETISCNKPFCYNIGYVIFNTEKQAIVCKRDFVVEQVWHNRPLFETAYYADKRPIYVEAMRARRCTMDKYGYIQRQMSRDIRDYQVQGAYAFNSAFDDRVFDFNAEYYHCNNALDNVPVFDIRGYACKVLFTDEYREFCDRNEAVTNPQGDRKFITDADGYKTTAESFYCYLMNATEFNEAHTALADSEIELAILLECLKRGCELQENYATAKSYPRNNTKHYKLNLFGEITEGDATAISVRKTKNGTCITLK